ncbi:hypothetical protein [Bradyrhizobium sp. SEMIA]|uniref:hypothetical protein n=1 Tax=Bradyrhizobium sp. SEMIA TaxID=2597515 RepID=UPI0018A35A78|nr:hypothetical protein [Bradyrhizobium sp. SEMIA]QOG17264.1 hypothetical protein FOM02_07795 [Bradyrhizobium sp. SEMIA]
MTDPTFYVAAQERGSKPPKITGYVPSTFLMRNGRYVVDPVAGASQQFLYSDSSGSNKTPGAIANPNNYVIVPKAYDETAAKRVADTIAAMQRLGTVPALALVAHSFMADGPEDLQRHQRWGIPANSFVPAYISGASDHFGYVTGAAGLPREVAETGGGVRNLFNRLTHPGGNIDTSGKIFLSKINEANLAQGHVAGAAARQKPSAYDDYGYPASPRETARTIGDGNGVLSFLSSLTGVDPDEPPQVAWPPQADAPARYLSSYRVRP